MRFSQDTIAAIATPMGEAALGIVRISGPQALDIAGKIFSPARKERPSQKSHTLRHGRIVQGGRVLDEVLLAVFKSPASYTGEDVAEIIGHGGYATLRGVLHAALEAGARPAEPGEFTKRAFLNGKMDLSQAEAVMELISAKSDRAAALGLKTLEGGLKRWVQQLRAEMMEFYAPLEAAIDFPEEDIETLAMPELLRRVERCSARVKELITAGQGMHVERHGVCAAILGRPNAGKSSLFNSLLINSRALVSTVPGTTRDMLEETITHKGHALRLVDTAGLRKNAGKVEAEGIARTLIKAKDADCVLYLIDASRPLHTQDKDFLGRRDNGNCILVLSKNDLPRKITGAQIRAWEKKFSVCAVSSQTGEGLTQLKDKIVASLQAHAPSSGDLAPNARHLALLQSAYRSLQRASESCRQNKSYEFIALDISGALQSMGEITGETAGEELLHSIFSKFCIGK